MRRKNKAVSIHRLIYYLSFKAAGSIGFTVRLYSGSDGPPFSFGLI